MAIGYESTPRTLVVVAAAAGIAAPAAMVSTAVSATVPTTEAAPPAVVPAGPGPRLVWPVTRGIHVVLAVGSVAAAHPR